jgi:hypothetical protein
MKPKHNSSVSVLPSHYSPYIKADKYSFGVREKRAAANNSPLGTVAHRISLYLASAGADDDNDNGLTDSFERDSITGKLLACL